MASNEINPLIEGKGILGEEGKQQLMSFLNNLCEGDPIGSQVIKEGKFQIQNILFKEDGEDNGKKTFYGQLKDSGENLSGCTNLGLNYTLSIKPEIFSFSDRSSKGEGGTDLSIKGRGFFKRWKSSFYRQ